MEIDLVLMSAHSDRISGPVRTQSYISQDGVPRSKTHALHLGTCQPCKLWRLIPHRLKQKLQGWSPAICVPISLLDHSVTNSSLRIIELFQPILITNKNTKTQEGQVAALIKTATLKPKPRLLPLNHSHINRPPFPTPNGISLSQSLPSVYPASLVYLS